MISLALLRHGHTPWNREGRIQGRSDIPLDDAARHDLADQQLPPGWETADLWSSPLSRATETARLVGGRAPRIAPELTEMNWGAFEGKHGADLIQDPNSGYLHIEDWGWDYRPPGGESPAEIWNRLSPWVAALKRDSVAVCHIGIMRILLARAYGWTFTGEPPFRIKRNRLFVIQIDGTRLTPQSDPIRLTQREAKR